MAARALPNARWTCLLAVSSPFGVLTGLAALNGCAHGPLGRLRALSQKARNSTAPREPGFSLSFQAASTRQESPTPIARPELTGARPRRKERHIVTSCALTRVAPYGM